MDLPILVVGQGIAGSVLALAFTEYEIPFLAVEQHGISRSSSVAAGLFNPVVFKRLTEGWRAFEAVERAKAFYQNAEQITQASFLNVDGILRVHGSDDERRMWSAKRENHTWSKILGESSRDNGIMSGLHAPFGTAHIHEAGFIHPQKFLDTVKSFLSLKQQLYSRTFEHNDLRFSQEAIAWNGMQFYAVVFCEGVAIQHNPYFAAEILKPAKGEVLIIEAPDLPQRVFNGKVYGVPIGNARFRIGATYEWDAPNAEPTQTKYDELYDQLCNLIKVPFRVIGHEAGIRPSSPNRRPFFINSAREKRVFAFNGLGTKGVLLAPMLALEIASYFRDGSMPNPEFTLQTFG
ncbi:MAG: NAD(P)/FAD-dependent oxidoreductase [Bacteroidia bacterium]|jgi:glycine oxidase